MRKTLFVSGCILLLSSFAFAGEVTVKISLVSDHGAWKEIGTVTASDTKNGLLLTPQLSGLTPGLHGFHVHAKPAAPMR